MDKQAIFGQNKILNHVDRLYEWQNDGEKTLITVEIDMTNNCNNRCPKCIGWAGKKGKESLTEREAKDYLFQIRKFGARAIVFTGGGEPLMNKDTLRVVKFARQIGFDIGFITNGLLLSKEAAKVILKNCVWCRISLDADCPRARIANHGLNDFETVVRNIKNICELKKKLKSKCTLGTGYLTGPHTISGMEEFIKLSKKLGVDYAQFRPFHYDKTDISEDYFRLQKNYSDNKFKVVASIHKYSRYSDKIERPYPKCYGVNFATVIAANANMYICCHMRGYKKYSLGNLREKSMAEIWKNREKVFKKIDFKDCPPFCRCDEFNRVLFEIKQRKQHINFL